MLIVFVAFSHVVGVAALSERLEAFNHASIGGFWDSATSSSLPGVLMSQWLDATTPCA
jgi:hypothetical protein